MALATITGRLSDFAGNPGLEVAPRIIFAPNGAAAGGTTLFYSRPVIVDTFAPDGSWTVQLEETDALWRVAGGDVWYDVTVDRLVSGVDREPWDHPGWSLRVPPGGGQFASLVTAPANPAQIWYGPEAPSNPSMWTGWYDTDADPSLGVPNLFEWE